MKGKNIVIVGGSSGIGLALAKKATQAGANVTIASRSSAKLKLASDEIEQPITIYKLDASIEEEVIGFFKELGVIDHLISTIKPTHISQQFVDTEICNHKSAFEAKYWGQYFLALHAIRSNSVSEGIILTSGIAASRGYVGFSGTAAINGAIESLVKSLAVELAPIRVNAVSPGFIERFPNDLARYSAISDLGSNVPLRRLGSNLEAAEGYMYLMKNKYTTGSILTIDGGELCA
ncbi:SDR family oxidoreductase [Hydrogenovibrio sp. SC-1]|uniref:SDR family oxidoreductase n=1 Tax=Hydrogenovibrio sp. SC-1 TaxID=2065820 RepID=UPI001304179B|nr:SDR family oxidoreductase [Hydrogenovibrio sp. SC-1]